jgi:CRISPR-associated protein Cpf1
MENNKDLSQFTNLYSLSKTLRFELVPVGKTLENFSKSGILSQDELRANEYKKIKKIIDEYHKHFIEKSLQEFSFTEDSLKKYVELAKIANKDDKQKKEIESIQNNLRKEIVRKFVTNHLFGKELIQEDLFDFLKKTELSKFYMVENLNKEDCEKLVRNFNKWTTYFTGFHENRKNMYSSDDKATAIAYRLINENLPKFISNISVFVKVKDKLQSEFGRLKKELNLPENIDYYFNLNNYNKFITQSGIDLFNMVIGGKTLENKTKIKGLNEYINLYNQKQHNKNDRLPKFTPLFKMILSDRVALSWLPEQFETDNEVLEAINQWYLSVSEKQENGQSVFEQLKKLLQEIKPENFDFNKIYLRNDTSLTNISQKHLGYWGEIKKAVEMKYEEEHPKGEKKSQEKYDEEKEAYFKRFDSLSLGFINNCLELLEGKNKGNCIHNYFLSLGIEKDENVNSEIEKDEKIKPMCEDWLKWIDKKYLTIKNILNSDYPTDKNLSQDNKNIEKIKAFLDSILGLLHFVKPLCGKGDETDKDEKFYGEFLDIFEKLSLVTRLYDKVRNYATRKPYSIEKIKLNFENSTLCNGWDVNKEQDNTTILLRKNDSFYLAIMNYSEKTKFDEDRIEKESIVKKGECFYEKIDYKLLPGPNKMLPKVFFSEKGKKEFNPSTEILESYESGCHKKGDTFEKGKMCKLIDFFKSSIAKHEDWKNFKFNFSNTSSYESIDKFYNEVSKQGYKITFRNVSEKYIDKLVENGKLYLFQIYNKDFSKYAKGTPNMHTLYWKELFSSENLKNVVYKLNGEAEIFFRKSSIKPKVTHQANKIVKNKNKFTKKTESIFKYDLIKDKRYTVDKFQFHCPITLNFNALGNEYINDNVKKFIRQNGIKHIIGIDRGERHLLYVCIIDLNGKIIKQFSLNEIINEYNDNKYKTDYHKLLDDKEKDRTKQRQEWKTIENIKDLKEGYLSQVVHKVSELIAEYNAIVILEDLNFGFIRGRQKVEKSVYQQFEKKLIDKLNYLVFKKKDKNEIGGVLKALQLTNRFESFKKLGKQSGFLFYIPAWNTSKMCPVTGFVNLFDCCYESIDKAKKFFDKFTDICYNKKKDLFEFVVEDYNIFNSKAEDTRQEWIICTNDKRIRTFRNNNKWDSEEIVLVSKFKELLKEYHVNFDSNLKAEILAQNTKEFFEKMLFLFKLTVQMRNSFTGTDIDYMISPVADINGKFYDSRNCDKTLPENADANGAYNIARKGLWIIEQLKQASDNNLNKLKLAISNKEWLQFSQKLDQKNV